MNNSNTKKSRKCWLQNKRNTTYCKRDNGKKNNNNNRKKGKVLNKVFPFSVEVVNVFTFNCYLLKSV